MNTAPRPIQNIFDAMAIRAVRNECNEFMTHDPSKIGILRQLNWYFRNYRPSQENKKLVCYLFWKENSATPIGYGVIRFNDKKYWLTGGIIQKERGKGFGKILFQKLIERTPSNEVWLDVLETNQIAYRLYKKLGFRKIRQSKNEQDKNIIIMSLRKNS